MRLALGVAVLCSLAVAPTVAAAQPGNTPPTLPSPGSYQPPAPYPPPPGGTRTERYGSTIALVDGLSMAAILVGAVIVVANIADDSRDGGDGVLGGALMIGGVGGYVIGGPLVHHYKHNNSAAWKSLGLRLGLPVLAGIIGAAMQDGSDPEDDAGASLAGIAIAGAMVIDWVFLAKHEVRF